MQIILNTLSGKVRRETLGDREYLVAPVSMIVPGVLNGSKGPLLYTENEIARCVDAWNGMPVVVNHPTNANGHPVSARSPKVLDKYQVGSVYYATNTKGKLDGEAWIDASRLRSKSPEVATKIENGEKVELSTGLFTDNEPVKNREDASYNGKKYSHIARNFRPDHLAILPRTKGACSIDDGCGVNVNEELDTEHYLDWDVVHNEEGCDSCGPKCDCQDCKVKYHTENHAKHDQKSHGRKGSKVKKGSTVTKTFGDNKTGTVESLSSRDGKIRATVKWNDGSTSDVSLSKLKTTGVDTSFAKEVQKTTESVKDAVKRVPHYGSKKSRQAKYEKMFKSAVGNELIDNSRSKEKTMPLCAEKREELIQSLVKNEATPYDSDDIDYLESVTDEKLTYFVGLATNMGEGDHGMEYEDDSHQDDKSANMKKKKKAVVIEAPAENESKTKTAKEWLADAPPEIAQAVTNAMALEQKQKDQYINAIVANEANQFTKDWLQGRTIDELKGLASLAVAGNKDAPATTNEQVSPLFTAASPFPGLNTNEGFEQEDQDMIDEPFDWTGIGTASK